MSSWQPRKRSHISSQVDRLSNLPKDAIESILTRVPFKEAVRTSILSRAWRYGWTHLPYLVFNYLLPTSIRSQSSKAEFERKFVKSVDQVLLLHKGPIHKFKLSISSECNIYIDNVRWFLFLSRNGVREIFFQWSRIITHYNQHRQHRLRYIVPSCLFSCQEILSLELCGCMLIPPHGFSNLTLLKLYSVTFLSDEGLEKLISNCPLLSKLILGNVSGCTNIRLHAPNLVDIMIASDLIPWFEETPVLSNASIDAWDPQSVENVLCCVPSIRRLQLVGNTLQVFSQGNVPAKLPTTTFQLSQYLSLSIDFRDKQQKLAALCIFRSSPSLDKIDINSDRENDITEILVEEFWEGQNDFNYVFPQLKVLNVDSFEGTTAELKFIGFVLTSSPVLEKLQIKLLNIEESTTEMTELFRKLLGLRRISSRAEIVIP